MKLPTSAALYALLFFSGSAGVAYQTVWAKSFAVALGHEMPSLLAVVAAFFAGLSLGAWTLSDRIKRSKYPAYWYAALELVIAFWAVVTLLLVPVVSDVAQRVIGIDPSAGFQWSIGFALPFITLLPSTFAIGATLPAIEQVIARFSSHNQVVGGAYAANTAGAVVGVLISVFWLLPKIGQSQSLIVFAAVNLMCAVGIIMINKRLKGLETVQHIPRYYNDSQLFLWVLLFVTGLLGIGYEVVAVRVMSQVFEGTLYSFATALAVYLIASSFGAAVFQKFQRRFDSNNSLHFLLLGLSYSSLTGLLILYGAESIYRTLRVTLGDSVVAVFISEMLLAVSVFFVPSFLMGMLFALLAQRVRDQRDEMGRALGVNTLGGAIAPFLFGVAFLPSVGAKWALGFLSLSYLMLYIVSSVYSKVRSRYAIAYACAIPVVVLLLLPSLHVITLRDGERTIAYREGVMAATAVVEHNTLRNLRVNNRYQMGGTSTEALLFQQRQAHLPILLHPAPRRALFLGVASGATVGAAALYSNLEIDGVELVPEVLELLEYFSPHNGFPQTKSNVHLYVADARRFIRASSKPYDVIVADLFHPTRDGAGLLFTVEHYEAVSNVIADGGVFCHWLPFHQLDTEMIKLIARSFLTVFPDAQLMLASDLLNYPALGLVTGLDNRCAQYGYLQNRVADLATRQALEHVLIRNDLQLFSSVILDSETLTQWAGSGALNTDNRPLLSYLGPQFTYMRKSRPYGRLMELLEHYAIESTQIYSDAQRSETQFSQRLEKYAQARNIYLTGLRTHMEEGESAALPIYLSAAKASQDHETSFAQVFRIAVSMAKHSPKDALSLVESLVKLRPDIPAVVDFQRELRAQTNDTSTQ